MRLRHVLSKAQTGMNLFMKNVLSKIVVDEEEGWPNLLCKASLAVLMWIKVYLVILCVSWMMRSRKLRVFGHL